MHWKVDPPHLPPRHLFRYILHAFPCYSIRTDSLVVTPGSERVLASEFWLTLEIDCHFLVRERLRKLLIAVPVLLACSTPIYIICQIFKVLQVSTAH